MCFSIINFFPKQRIMVITAGVDSCCCLCPACLYFDFSQAANVRFQASARKLASYRCPSFKNPHTFQSISVLSPTPPDSLTVFSVASLLRHVWALHNACLGRREIVMTASCLSWLGNWVLGKQFLSLTSTIPFCTSTDCGSQISNWWGTAADLGWLDSSWELKL